MREPPVLETPCDPAPTAGRVLSRLAVKGALLALVLAVLFFFVLLSSVVISPGGLPRGRAAKIRSDLRNIFTVAEAIHADTGRYPESIESMVGFKNEDGSIAIACLEKYPKDPWGHEYVYEISPDGSPRVKCLGSDNQPGGDGEAADTVRTGGD